LVSGSSDGTVRLWDTDKRDEAMTFDLARLGEVRSVAISKDSKTLAAGVRYGTVRVYDLATREGKTLKGHVSDVWGVAFTPDGKTLASGDGDWDRPGEVKLWNVETAKEVATLKHTGEVLCLAISADGRQLAAGSWDKSIKLWQLSKVLPEKKP
jgi:WD40 repeat protein